ncbi:MAG: hypothetical protein JWM02_1013 [Frankiales bacterium]|nr:hypothetical protein [Frankiales bacterium]
MTRTRRLLLLVLTVSCFGLSVPSAWATFTNRTAHAAVSSFSTTTIAAPTVTSVTRCTLSSTVRVNWTVSSSTFVTSQLVELSASATMAPLTASQTFNDNTTQTKTFTVGFLSGSYSVRVTARFANWSTASTVLTSSAGLLC